ncbi:TRAP transporter substrate-binding protein DctP [Thermodesulfobacteriota bacterium]
MKKVRVKILTMPCILLVLALITVFSLHTNKAAAAEKKILLRLVDFVPLKADQAQALKWWGDELMKRTDGRVKCEYYFSQSLIKAKQQFNALSTGIADVGGLQSAWHPAETPLFMLGAMPALPTDSFRVALTAANKLGETASSQAEFKRNNVRFITASGHSGDYIYSTKPIRRVQDMKGLTVASWGYYSRAFKAWGAQPMSVASPEIFEAMKRGVVVGCNKPLLASLAQGMIDVAKYVMLPKIGINTQGPLVMNLDKWNSLPKDIKNIIQGINKEYPEMIAGLYDKSDGFYIKKMKEKGIEFNTLSDEENAKLPIKIKRGTTHIIQLANSSYGMPYKTLIAILGPVIKTNPVMPTNIIVPATLIPAASRTRTAMTPKIPMVVPSMKISSSTFFSHSNCVNGGLSDKDQRPQCFSLLKIVSA